MKEEFFKALRKWCLRKTVGFLGYLYTKLVG